MSGIDKYAVFGNPIKTKQIAGDSCGLCGTMRAAPASTGRYWLSSMVFALAARRFSMMPAAASMLPRPSSAMPASCRSAPVSARRADASQYADPLHRWRHRR